MAEDLRLRLPPCLPSPGPPSSELPRAPRKLLRQCSTLRSDPFDGSHERRARRCDVRSTQGTWPPAWVRARWARAPRCDARAGSRRVRSRAVALRDPMARPLFGWPGPTCTRIHVRQSRSTTSARVGGHRWDAETCAEVTRAPASRTTDRGRRLSGLWIQIRDGDPSMHHGFLGTGAIFSTLDQSDRAASHLQPSLVEEAVMPIQRILGFASAIVVGSSLFACGSDPSGSEDGGFSEDRSGARLPDERRRCQMNERRLPLTLFIRLFASA
jgi:hypothetical protein